MNPLVRKTIGIILATTLVVFAYLCSFLPLTKSTALIRSMRAAEAFFAEGKLTPAVFEDIMSRPLLAPSPIGQEEAVRQVTGMILDMIRQINNPGDVERLINFAESFYTPIIERGRGMSFSQDLYVLGFAHQAAAIQTRDGRYLAFARKYFEEGLRRGPNRPQFLYGLFDVYRMQGDIRRAREIGEKIISLWPGDERVARMLKELP
jgi:hypothetical protein